MKSDAIAFGIAGVAFGLIAGWIIGTQQAGVRPSPATTVAASSSASASSRSTAAVLDENKVSAFKSVADREPKNPTPRVELGNLYFDAERYDDAITWYAEALKVAPNDPNVSTDLGISYFYTNQPDKALDQFAHSLKVRAYGKQDLAGAQQAWEQVVQFAPDSVEAQQAKRALDALRSAHPASGQKPGA